jgi:NAD(P)-dependent dehydrogenase (short-subunit alcohol dehydrogenase family)
MAATSLPSFASIQDKVIAITGAASGVGLETSKKLFLMGARLSLTDIREDVLAAAVKQITGLDKTISSDNVMSMVADVRNNQQIKDWILQTVSKFGALDGAVNAAGVISKHVGMTDISQITEEDYDFVVNINQKGVFFCMKEEIGAMKTLPEAPRSIVNIASISGIVGDPFHSQYSATKHAVIGFTRTVAKEVGRKGIRVNAVAP